MTGSEAWAVARWVIGLYLIALGTYSLVTRRMPRLRRPRWSFPFPPGSEYSARTAIVLALICIAMGFPVVFARTR